MLISLAGINCVDDSNNVIIRRNTVWECEGDGSSTGGGIRVIEATGITIDRNKSYSNSDSGNASYGIQVDLVDSTSIVSNNICYLNDDQGISVLGCTGTKIYNNTCVENLRDGIYLGEEAGASKPVTGCVFKNNLCAENGGEGAASANWNQMFIHQTANEPNTYNYNLYYRAADPDIIHLFWIAGPDNLFTIAEWQARDPLYGPNSLRSDPKLDTDYSLTTGSGAIGAGTDLSGVVDYDYNGDRRTAPYDIGAYRS